MGIVLNVLTAAFLVLFCVVVARAKKDLEPKCFEGFGLKH